MNLQEAQSRHKLLLQRAKHMRSNPTDAEADLWKLLRAKRFTEMKWRQQQIIDDRYIFDFICFEHRVIVEADGGQHSESSNDKRRDKYLHNQGFRILRFWNNDILNNLEGVATAILEEISSYPSPTASRQQAAKTSYPLPQGERNN